MKSNLGDKILLKLRFLVFKMTTLVKNRIKELVKKSLKFFNVLIIFRGERSEQGLFPYFVEFFLSQSQGILHVGAHYGQESGYYALMGKPVLWIEADPKAFKVLSRHISNWQNQRALNAFISDSAREANLHVTSNNGMSSSLHPLSTVGEEAFNIENTHSIELRTSTLNQLLASEETELDFWVIDVQGHEYEVLRGSDLVIRRARWILIEGSDKPFYENMSLFPKVKQLLESHGFSQIYRTPGDHFEAMFLNVNSFLGCN
jgi:FkbM family methyltransferase